jgi:hypothetical protein
MNKTKSTFLALLAVLLSPMAANADLITSNTITDSTVIDFSTQATVSSLSGPIQIGVAVGEDITVTGSPNTGLYTNFNGWGLIANGTWGDGMTYISANDARPGDLIFSFNDGPVSAVGGFMNHAPGRGSDLLISVLDEFMNVLESYNITTMANIVTPGGLNAGGFRGIDRLGQADISYFVVTGYVQVLDDLTFARAESVPEPGTLALLGIGLFGMGLARRNKKS